MVPVQGDPTKEWLGRRNIEEFLLRMEERVKSKSESDSSEDEEEEEEEEKLRPPKRPRRGLSEGMGTSCT